MAERQNSGSLLQLSCYCCNIKTRRCVLVCNYGSYGSICKVQNHIPAHNTVICISYFVHIIYLLSFCLIVRCYATSSAERSYFCNVSSCAFFKPLAVKSVFCRDDTCRNHCDKNRYQQPRVDLIVHAVNSNCGCMHKAVGSTFRQGVFSKSPWQNELPMAKGLICVGVCLPNGQGSVEDVLVSTDRM